LYFYDIGKNLGILLFKYYFLVIFGLAFFLLIAIIGSIFLTYNNIGNVKRFEIFKQIERSFVKILKFKK